MNFFQGDKNKDNNNYFQFFSADFIKKYKCLII